MIEIPEAPTVGACAPCGSSLLWLWSPRRSGWVAFVQVGKDTLRLHGCRHAQEPRTWRDLQRVDPQVVHRGAALVREQLKTGAEEDG